MHKLNRKYQSQQYQTVNKQTVNKLCVHKMTLQCNDICSLSTINSARTGKHGGSSHVTASQGSQSAATVTLLAVSFYLIFTTLPVTVCYVMYLGFPEGDSSLTLEEQSVDPTWIRNHVYRDVRTTVEELAMSKYACNFYIYLLTGTAFRHELRRIFSTTFGRCCAPLDVVSSGGRTQSCVAIGDAGPLQRIADQRGRQIVAGYKDCREQQLSKGSAL